MRHTNPFIKGYLLFYTTYQMWKDIMRFNTSCYDDYFWRFLNGDTLPSYQEARKARLQG